MTHGRGGRPALFLTAMVLVGCAGPDTVHEGQFGEEDSITTGDSGLTGWGECELSSTVPLETDALTPYGYTVQEVLDWVSPLATVSLTWVDGSTEVATLGADYVADSAEWLNYSGRTPEAEACPGAVRLQVMATLATVDSDQLAESGLAVLFLEELEEVQVQWAIRVHGGQQTFAGAASVDSTYGPSLVQGSLQVDNAEGQTPQVLATW